MVLRNTGSHGEKSKLKNEVTNDFENPRGEETIITVHWFDERPKIGIRLPYCSKNEVESKRFIKKLNTYTKENDRILSCQVEGRSSFKNYP